ncbi:ankyrin repeat domain-containing protein 29-like isoform X2 [Homarus americanus]|uniref:ankyrin repeat domain-containing protein 29-like isoform X2 n=1 Tax=Homarus americanus TaxID=6706 RepID=UPI001C483453|nr:ankyrin repeat domain-containing protein 29-like isoform X2 [Homarus americanus]
MGKSRASVLVVAMVVILSTAQPAFYKVQFKNNFIGRYKMVFAAREGSLQQVKRGLDAGIDVNFQVNDGWTALMWSARYGHKRVVNFLMDRGADLNHQNRQETALTWAAYGGHYEVCKMLLDHGALPDLHNALGSTGLSFAAREGHPEIAKLFLEYNASVNMETFSGDTPLTWATLKNHDDIIKILLEYDADVTHANLNGETALTIAASQGQLNSTRLLLEAGADTNVVDDENRTPLYLAAKNGHHQVVEQLLQHCPDLSITDYSDNSALDIANKMHQTNTASMIQEQAERVCWKDGVSYPVQDTLTLQCHKWNCHCSGNWTITPLPNSVCGNNTAASVSSRGATHITAVILAVVAVVVVVTGSLLYNVYRHKRSFI